MVRGLAGVSGLSNAANVSITGGTGISIVQLSGGVVFVHAPSGTMANNGAVTFGTSLGRTIANAWMLFPAGAIAAGVPAAATWYFVQMSSATVGTVFNNTYTTGPTDAPASPTAFVTTGPGAFTGVTAVATGPNVTLAAGVMGTKGTLTARQTISGNNSAGTKTFTVKLGSTTYWSVAATTATNGAGYVNVANQGSASAQYADTPSGSYHPLGATGAGIFGSENTANALVIAYLITKNTATDFAILEQYNIQTAITQ